MQFDPRSSWVLLAAINGNAAAPDFSSNASEMFEKVKHVMSTTTFVNRKNSLVKAGVLIETKSLPDKFYTVNFAKILPMLKKEELAKLTEVVLHDAFRTTVFNPCNYPKNLRFPAFVAFSYFFGICLAFKLDPSSKVKHTSSMTEILGKAHQMVSRYYETVLTKDDKENKRLTEVCIDVADIVEAAGKNKLLGSF